MGKSARSMVAMLLGAAMAVSADASNLVARIALRYGWAGAKQ